ncbi:MAG: phosphopantetheine-binding protein [Nitrosospira sp.]|nr:phosphopantetheine-binding protein [Nitrosospira sp.]
MSTAELEAKVIQFIAEKVESQDPSKTTASSQFGELGLDSMDVVQLLFDAEEAFGVNFEGEEAKELRSVGDIISFIDKHQMSTSS